MPSVRVFLCTYRRPPLLRRALASLLAQTFTDWTCELHNDDPADNTPRAILAELAPGDPRINYSSHAYNWGAVATFNHAFAGGPEPFASLLEDDNWWEPDFLATAVRELELRPAASLAWANMNLWQEQPDGHWIATGRTIWSLPAQPPPVVEFHPPELLQGFDALHSNGAMVFRPAAFRVRSVPPTLPFAIIEQARERAATGSLLFLPTPLANYACTRTTTRDADPARWLQAKLLVAASWLEAAPFSPQALADLWVERRSQRPRDTGIFFWLALALREPRLLRSAGLVDWIHALLSATRHPRRLADSLRFRRNLPEVWTWFVAQTRANHARPARATVLAKRLPS